VNSSLRRTFEWAHRLHRGSADFVENVIWMAGPAEAGGEAPRCAPAGASTPVREAEFLSFGKVFVRFIRQIRLPQCTVIISFTIVYLLVRSKVSRRLKRFIPVGLDRLATHLSYQAGPGSAPARFAIGGLFAIAEVHGLVRKDQPCSTSVGK